TATTEIYTLSLHDALPISPCGTGHGTLVQLPDPSRAPYTPAYIYVYGSPGIGAPEGGQQAFRARPGALSDREKGSPRRAGERASALRDHRRLQRLASAARASVRRRLRRALHRAGCRQRHLAGSHGYAAIRGGPLAHAALRRARARGLRRGPGGAGGQVRRRARAPADRDTPETHPSRTAAAASGPGCANADESRGRSQRAL